jgi:uncharacterized protein YjcR
LHSSQVKFIAYALWIKGHSMPMIAHWLNMRPKQVAGLIARSPWPNRSVMTDKERQAALDELKAIRENKAGATLDQGVLNRFVWTVEPLERAQQRG